jgi:hypothetical protein
MRIVFLALAAASSLAFTQSGDGGAPAAMQSCGEQLRNMCRDPQPGADGAFLQSCMATKGFLLKTYGDCADASRPLGAACFESAPWMATGTPGEPGMSH